MALELVTAPAAEPISTADAKTHLRVDVADDNTYIDTLVVVARQQAEAFTKRALITQTWDLKLDCFPAGDRIILPLPPLQSITSVSYVDTNGDSQTWASSNYSVSTPSGDYAVHGHVALAYGVTWPSTRSIPEAVTIRFVAGYGSSASDVPQGIIQGMNMFIGHMYENRQDVVQGSVASMIPQASRYLWMPYQAKRW